MLEIGRSCLYNKNHLLPIFDKNGQIEDKRTLNLTVHNLNDTVEIKIRDPSEYNFNYSANIDLADFEVMRSAQCLDINFTEFKSNLLEMLQQFQREEMFLKCIRSDMICTLVFYGKSKIKSIVYLTVDLKEANQREILQELINNLQGFQESNEKLKKQLSYTKQALSEKDDEIAVLKRTKSQLQSKFHSDLSQVEMLLNQKIRDSEHLLSGKIAKLITKLGRLSANIDIFKCDTASKAECNSRLIKSLEALRLENNDNAAFINRLKQENSALHAVNCNQEKNINDMRKALTEKECVKMEIQKKNEELRSDLEKATIVISQKKATVEELSKDLVQANQMLVNFNNHYDSKLRQIEELQSNLETKERIINDHKQRYNELLRDFDNYKSVFNKESHDKLKHDLLIANNRVDELESALRKANKINTLLTDKVNQHQKLFNN